MSTTSRLPREQVVALRPGDVKVYLTSRNWVAGQEGPQSKALIFREPKTGAEVLLPMDRTLGDYALRMAEVVSAVAQVEDRPVLEILNDLSMPPGDVFRFRVAGSVASLGQLPLDEGINLLQGGRDLLWSSAYSLHRPEALLPPRGVKQVDDFLKTCRLGQTERGSFVATILAPVPPVLQRCMDFGEGEVDSEPFARQATTRLMSSLGLVSDAIRSNAADRILEGVPKGISANLCEALVAMKPPGDESRLDIQVTWARSRPNLPDVPRVVSFPQEDFPIIEEAGRQLRTRAYAKRERYEGPALRVERALRSYLADVSGRLVLSTLVGGATARVKVDLGPHDFGRACDAIRDGHSVAVTGIIRHDVKAREYVLSEPSDFVVLTTGNAPQRGGTPRDGS